MVTKAYWTMIPAAVRLDHDLTYGARLLYGEINTLSQKSGKCWATNAYFAEIYQVDKRTIVNWMKELRDKRYISVKAEREKNSPVVKRRYITPCVVEQEKAKPPEESTYQKREIKLSDVEF